MAGRVSMADLYDPPETASLEQCPVKTLQSVKLSFSNRLKGQRRAALSGVKTHRSISQIDSTLRRLQNPRVAAYYVQNRIVLSEPFNRFVCRVIPTDYSKTRRIVNTMMRGMFPLPEVIIALQPFGIGLLERAQASGVSIQMLQDSESFEAYMDPRDAEYLDNGHAQGKLGMFALRGRVILIRASAGRATIAHEFAHAVDSVLASRRNSYLSHESKALTSLCDDKVIPAEIFAEAVRGYLEINDDNHDVVTRSDVFDQSPKLYSLVENALTIRGNVMAKCDSCDVELTDENTSDEDDTMCKDCVKSNKDDEDSE